MPKGKEMNGVPTLYPDEVQTYMQEHGEGDYVLLDVRQPGEYAAAHLPGARLVPLPQLSDSREELDPAKPTIVYCASGGRSRMATQLLNGMGFREVYNMLGGIQAWENRTATGPREFHLGFIRGNETPDEIIFLAYRMEDGLKRFHEAFKSQTEDAALIRLLDGLIKAEESHEKTLLSLREMPAAPLQKNSDDHASGLMEGGIDIDDFMAQNRPFLNDVPGYLDVAMMIETQALDLYLRMAADSRNEESRNILLRIANEEKSHLRLLGDYLDRSGAVR